jgi:hypothetical protein
MDDVSIVALVALLVLLFDILVLNSRRKTWLVTGMDEANRPGSQAQVSLELIASASVATLIWS